MKLRLLGIVLGICFFASNANAGLLIDPYVGTGSSKSALEFSTTDEDDTDSGAVFGSRLGFSMLLFSAGIDYQVLSGDSPITNTSAFVGVDLPILFRFWAEYFLSSKFDSEDLDDSNIDVTFANGYGFGIGFTGLPLVSINLELENLNYDLESSGVEGELALVNTVLSVSFPIDL